MTDITPDREKFCRGFPDSVKYEMEDEEMEFMDGIWKKELPGMCFFQRLLKTRKQYWKAPFTASVIWVMWHL